MKELTEDETLVRKELTQNWDQLQINSRNVCGTGADKHAHDLLAVCIEFYLDKPIEYQLKVISDGKLVNFITHLMNFQLKHDTTRYWHHYKKFDIRQRELYVNYNYGPKYTGFNKPFEDEEDPIITCMKSVIDDLDVYNKMIIDEHLVKGEKLTNLSKKYKITYSNLKKDVEKLKLDIKQKCKKFR